MCDKIFLKTTEILCWESIVVADNANSNDPPDDTVHVVRKVDPNIQYIYVQQGLKTRYFKILLLRQVFLCVLKLKLIERKICEMHDFKM